MGCDATGWIAVTKIAQALFGRGQMLTAGARQAAVMIHVYLYGYTLQIVMQCNIKDQVSADQYQDAHKAEAWRLKIQKRGLWTTCI